MQSDHHLQLNASPTHSPLRILVSAGLPLERDALTRALLLLRPTFDAMDVPPDVLDQEIVLHSPDVVICSSLSETIETRVPIWFVIRPGGEDRYLISMHGSRVEQPMLDLDGIISALDHAEHLLGNT